MKGIGGFLGLEHTGREDDPYHCAPALTTGRACFRLILQTVRPRRVHIPFYTCDALLGPLDRLGIEFDFYGIDRGLEPEIDPEKPGPDEMLVVVNYFGLKGDYVRGLAESLGPAVVVDDSQAFFRRGAHFSWSFNSVRKFFGVPDGAYLYGFGDDPVPVSGVACYGVDYLQRGAYGSDARAYRQFREHESLLSDQLLAMSEWTSKMVRAVDYTGAAMRRRENFRFLERYLGERNLLRIVLSGDDVPLYYPFLPRRPIRKHLIERGIYVPCIWPELTSRQGLDFVWERSLASDLCPLPVDQRYDAEIMSILIDEVIRALDQRRSDS